MNILEKFNNDSLEKLAANKSYPEFHPGDTLVVKVRIAKDRFQNYEGVCIARSGGGLNSSFTVRKISYGEGVERVFPLYSTNIEEIKVLRRGDVRRAKLYYLRDRSGKSARIAEATSGYKGKLIRAEKNSKK